MSGRQRCWRIPSPRWMADPLSGEGSRRRGGRWNRVGRPALYISERIETAIRKYHQEAPERPGVFVAYDIEANLIDLTAAAVLRGLGIEAAVLLAPWRRLHGLGIEPATWVLADRLSGEYQGARVPSAVADGTNVVLWRWNEPGGATASFHDPHDELASR